MGAEDVLNWCQVFRANESCAVVNVSSCSVALCSICMIGGRSDLGDSQISYKG